jgi:NAD dependent epimerase/dehydratase family enzyme
LPIKLGIGAALGSGKQYMPWIHIDDLCEIYIKAIEDNEMHGAYNAVAPDDKTNEDFIHGIAKALHQRIFLPNIPAFVLKLMLGEMSDMILKGSRVSSAKIEKTGFKFQFPSLETALTNIYQ